MRTAVIPAILCLFLYGGPAASSPKAPGHVHQPMSSLESLAKGAQLLPDLGTW